MADQIMQFCMSDTSLIVSVCPVWQICRYKYLTRCLQAGKIMRNFLSSYMQYFYKIGRAHV